MTDVDWAAIGVISGVVVASGGYLSAQMGRLEERLSARMDRVETRIDQLTERYIAHLEHHPR